MSDLITDDDLQDERLNTIEEIVNENSNDIDGKCFVLINLLVLKITAEHGVYLRKLCELILAPGPGIKLLNDTSNL